MNLMCVCVCGCVLRERLSIAATLGFHLSQYFDGYVLGLQIILSYK